MLAAPIVEDGRLVLVASSGGDDRQPAWYRNLNANPQVRVTITGSTRTMIARTATDQERAQLWPQITARYQGYARYQQQTERPILGRHPSTNLATPAAPAPLLPAVLRRQGTATRLVRPPTGQDTT
jgi:deazaflavin-dependent oxidoreductase (nitroreductase family)